MQDNKEIIYQQVADGMGQTALAIKRIADIIFAVIGLVALSPVMAIIALLIKRQQNGPVFFRQVRIGRGGKPFVIFKFRTLSSEAENEGPQLIAQGIDGASTPFERFLRLHHLDELPQLWNVLRGDMSLVGPRPERKYYIDKILKIDARYNLIYIMRPGLTSEATLYNGYTDTMDKMLRRLDMDIQYLANRSLWRDIKIIIKTTLSIITGRKF